MMYYYDCPVCGQKVSKALNACPNCGCPTVDMVEKEATQQAVVPQQVGPSSPERVYTPKKKSKAPIIAVIVALLVAAGVAVYFLFIKKGDSKDDGKSTNQVVEQNTQATEQASSDKVTQYMKDYTHAYSKILNGAEKTENFGRFYQHVWVDSIYKEDNEETNKYTKDENGNFYEDFNDALSQIWTEEENYRKYKAVEDYQSEVQTLMKNLTNPPEECKEAYEALKELYGHYIELSNLVLHPEGQSLQSFTDTFREADTATANCIDKVNIYIK